MIEVIDGKLVYNGRVLDKKDVISIKRFIERNTNKGIVSSTEVIANHLNNRFNKMKNEEDCNVLASISEKDSLNNYYKICHNLGIDYHRIMYLGTLGYNKRKVIFYTWFYYDQVNSKNEKKLSLKKLKEIENEDFLKNSTSIIDFIVAYKLGNKECYNRIFELESSYYLRTIQKKLAKFNYTDSKSLSEDILTECFLYLYEVIEKVVLRENARVKKYISKYMNNFILRHILDLPNNREVSLDSFINHNYEEEADYFHNPLTILINAQERDILNRAFRSLDREDQAYICDLYFKENAPSIGSILTGEIDGYDVHDSVGLFQDRFMELYEGEYGN